MYNKYSLENDEKRRIFNIAIEMLKKKGYENLSIRAICSEANISIGRFYHYFSSKQELLSFYYDEAVKNFRDETESKLTGLDIKEQLTQFYTWYADYTTNFGLEFVMYYFSNQNQALNCTTYNNVLINVTDGLLQKAVQNGYIIPDNKTIHEISVDICIIVKGAIFDWCVRHGDFSLSDYINDLLTRCLRGLL